MRTYRRIPLLAAIVTIAGAWAPAAYGFDNRAPGIGGVPTKPAAAAQQSSTGSDETLAFAVAGGALILVGAGITVTVRSTRRGSGAVRITS